jgi:RimJ/RimL family protein N-acetyltransferase
MATATLMPTLTLTVTDRPTAEALRTWWDVRQADPACALAFADDAPQNFTELRTRIVTGTYILYLVWENAGEVAGAMWLHDIQRDPDGTPHTGWVGAYAFPAFRQTGLATAMWHQVRARLEARGVRHFFAAVHIANTRSQAYATRHMGLHFVDRFAQFTRFGGVLTDCLIYTLHPEDAADAWAAAHARAHQQRLCAASSAQAVDFGRREPYFHMTI